MSGVGTPRSGSKAIGSEAQLHAKFGGHCNSIVVRRKVFEGSFITEKRLLFR